MRKTDDVIGGKKSWDPSQMAVNYLKYFSASEFVLSVIGLLMHPFHKRLYTVSDSHETPSPSSSGMQFIFFAWAVVWGLSYAALSIKERCTVRKEPLHEAMREDEEARYELCPNKTIKSLICPAFCWVFVGASVMATTYYWIKPQHVSPMDFDVGELKTLLLIPMLFPILVMTASAAYSCFQEGSGVYSQLFAARSRAETGATTRFNSFADEEKDGRTSLETVMLSDDEEDRSQDFIA